MLNFPFIVFARAWFEGNSAKSAASKLKATIIALGIGCLIGVVVISALGKNGSLAFNGIFNDAFKKIKIGDTLIISTVLIVVGIANAIAFKAGLFNIGVSGQMLFSAVITMMLGTEVLKNTGIGGVFLLIVLTMILGALIASLAGALKAFFNIHEVVTTILLNWALFFFSRWIASKLSGFLIDNGQGGSQLLTNDMQFIYRVPNSANVILIVFGVVFALVIAFIFWKTTFGFKLKAVGLSPDAAEYAGINRRRRIIFAMGLSGMASGLAGALVFLLQENQIPSSIFSSESLPTWGFDGIAIALLAFNNPIGVIPIAIFFGALRSGSSSLSIIGIDRQIYELIIGVIMYMAAVSSLFIRFRIIQLCYVYVRFVFADQRKELRKDYKVKKAALLASEVKGKKIQQTLKLWSLNWAQSFSDTKIGTSFLQFLKRIKKQDNQDSSVTKSEVVTMHKMQRDTSNLRSEHRQSLALISLQFEREYAKRTTRFQRLIRSRDHEEIVSVYKKTTHKQGDRKTYMERVKDLLKRDQEGKA